jgi:hypothetical protein
VEVSIDTERCQISRHVRNVATSSSTLQLSWRHRYHAVAAPTVTFDISPKQQLQDLLETDQRLHAIKPIHTISLQLPRYRRPQISGNLLIVPEVGNSHVEACSIWDLSKSVQKGSAAEESPFINPRGQMLDDHRPQHPMLVGRLKLKERVEAMAISEEENLLVIVTEL